MGLKRVASLDIALPPEGVSLSLRHEFDRGRDVCGGCILWEPCGGSASIKKYVALHRSVHHYFDWVVAFITKCCSIMRASSCIDRRIEKALQVLPLLTFGNNIPLDMVNTITLSAWSTQLDEKWALKTDSTA